MEATQMSIKRRMDKKAVVHIHKYYSAIKKNTFESILMRWMKLEPITQSEVSQKEIQQYSMLLLLLSRFSHVRICATPWQPSRLPRPGILQARTLQWVAISFSNARKWKGKVKVKSCPTLSDPMDCSLPGSSIHGIFQARVLEWVAIAFTNTVY